MKLDTPTRFSLALAMICVGAVILIAADASLLTIGVVLVGGLLLTFITMGGGIPLPEPAPLAIQTNEPIEAIFDALADPLLLIAGSSVTFANAAAKALLGPHIVGQDVRTGLRHPAITALLADEAATGIAEINGVGNAGQIWEIRVERATQGRRLVHMVDRTARHSAERARVDFVANASHELRTPLATLLGYIETLRDDAEAGNDPTTRARFLGIMDAQAKRMQNLVSDLISLSRIEAEKHAFPDHDVDLAALVTLSVEERHQNVALDVPAGIMTVKGDAVQLSQLIHNLIDNAIKYGGDKEPVRVSLARSLEDAITLAVSDKGDGIAPDHIPRLTERFYRVDAGRSQSAGGTGLGLSIVKHIAEHHRAKLSIDSKLGEGTTVTVQFPPVETIVTKMSSN